MIFDCMESFRDSLFSVGTYQRNLPVSQFLTQQGGGRNTRQKEEFEFTPMEYAENLETGVPMNQEYYNAMKEANDFGMTMQYHGIDVLNPDPYNPESLEAAKRFSELAGKAMQLGNNLQVGLKAAEKYQDKYSQKGVEGKKLSEARTGGFTTYDDLSNLRNSESDRSEFDKWVSEKNKLARIYYNQGNMQDANRLIQESKREMDNNYLALSEKYGEDFAKRMIDNAKAQLNEAVYEDTKNRTLDYRISQDQIRNAQRNRQLSQRDRQLAQGDERIKMAKANSGVGQGDPLYYLRRMASIKAGRGVGEVGGLGVQYDDFLQDHYLDADKSKKIGQTTRDADTGEIRVEVLVPKKVTRKTDDGQDSESVTTTEWVNSGEYETLDHDLMERIFKNPSNKLGGSKAWNNYLRIGEEQGYFDDNYNFQIPDQLRQQWADNYNLDDELYGEDE